MAQSLHGHAFCLGLKVQGGFKGKWLHVHWRTCKWAHFIWEQVTAQPNAQVWSQHSLHDCNLLKMTTEIWHRPTGQSPWSQRTSLGANCYTPQKGIGVQSIATSQSHIRLTRSHDSKSLNAWGHNTDPQMTMSWVPNDEDMQCHSHLANILTNPKFKQEFCILLACFLKGNAQLVKFFANLENKTTNRHFST